MEKQQEQKTYTKADRTKAKSEQKTNPLDGTDHGVTVALEENGNSYLCAFEFYPRMPGIIAKVPGAAFIREEKAWRIPIEEYEALKKAVGDLRNEHQAAAQSRSSIEKNALEALPEAKVYRANTKEGAKTFGKVLAVNDRYIAQQGGDSRIVIHNRDQVKFIPQIGEDRIFSYGADGRALVRDNQKRSERKQEAGQSMQQ